MSMRLRSRDIVSYAGARVFVASAGTMLPGNVIVQEMSGRTEVTAVDRVAPMQAIENDKLAAAANKVRGELKSVIQSL
jgi:uncharacterized protein (DUF302 family)